MKMKKLLLLTFVATAMFAVGCSDDDTPAQQPADTGSNTDTGMMPTDSSPGDSGTMGDSTSDTGGFPAPPTLGMQIDRMGRPAINTATNHSFDANETTKGMAKDKWNQESDPSKWADFVPEIEKNLAIIDAIDGTCGTQLAADMTKTTPDRYKALASLLADDRLWVNSAGATCGAYLGVEANALGILMNSDCGGRKPEYEVMKITYSAAAAGVLSGVTDGVTITDRSKVSTFPYMAAPK
jgi:hypothetical protein